MWNRYVAFDLGGESGRAVLFGTDGRRIEIEERHRYLNRPVLMSGHLFWNLPGIFEELKVGLKKCCDGRAEIGSLAIDTWGTDFGLVAASGEIAGLPFSYRDHKNDGMPEAVRGIIPDDELYSLTGIQVMKVNTLYQLYSLAKSGSPLVDAAHKLLFMPDLFSFLFCGSQVCEYTMASTSQLMHPAEKAWAQEIFDRLGLPARIMPEIVEPGTDLGTILPEQAQEMGVPQLRVRACATHDTASAVAAIPAISDGKPWAFISSGTWSLVGTEIDHPLLGDEARKANVTNEGGICGTIRLLKNVPGMWFIQRLKRDLTSKGVEVSYQDLAAAAESAEPFRRFIDPDDEMFHNPKDIASAIDDYCVSTKQACPQGIGEYARCIYESLAFRYHEVIATIEYLAGMTFARIHVVGGGAKSDLLNSFTASACGIDVHAGPFEAAAIGNGLVQALADGVFSSLADARSAVAESFSPEVFKPGRVDLWEKHYPRYQEVTGRK